MKKIFATMLALTMVVFAFAGCAAKEATPEEKTNPNGYELTIPSDDAVLALEGCTLSDEEMTNVINEYVSLVGEALTEEGVATSVVIDDEGFVLFNSEKTDENGDVITAEGVMAFRSIRECFAYLYETGQVDLSGVILATLEVLEDANAQGDVAADGSELVDSATDEPIVEDELTAEPTDETVSE